MPLYVCDTCHSIENTAFGHYHTRGLGYFKDKVKDAKALCSACMPNEYNNGKTRKTGWHNHFEREIATTELIKEIGEFNFVYTGNIPGVVAKNPCCDYEEPKKEVVPQNKAVRVICECGNSFKAKKDSICKDCGIEVKR